MTTVANIPTIIAVFSLFVSLASLYFSLRKSKLDKRLVSSQKRSELQKKVIDAKFKFEKQLTSFEATKKLWDSCESCPTDALELIEENIRQLIKQNDHYLAFLREVNDDTDPLTLERLIPFFYDQALRAEDQFMLTVNLIQGCHACREKISSNRGVVGETPNDVAPQTLEPLSGIE